ncbi:MAG: mutT/nudix family protein [Candidatus Gottesmanbacteria bacterium GW2011_GWA2_43_14]|uniref:MutT/nudix family protein n=1 Tax=Candidatus Gottesmanbacteria bacterium GW2011_GWA2_43_14 TaxID=1618443 RepID=A0A0G1DIQ3_9BACT|nr:MAG: mutT/nudix family protein [Candidatus Gottesmanbacteria bacterium GW2011_GWA2_43_14]
MTTFKFCPVCRSELRFAEKGKASYCRTCGFHYYHNPAPAVAAVIENKKREILLVGRKFEPQKNFWDLPGGFVDNDENLEEGMVREIREELGTDITGIKYIGSVPDDYLYKGYRYKVVTAFYAGELAGKIKVADDVSSFAWFVAGSLPFPRIAFKGTKAILKKYTASWISP